MIKQEIATIYNRPLFALLQEASTVHQQNNDPDIELCRLISVKTGGCTEDCAYCAQSNHNPSEIKINPLLALVEVEKIAQEAAQKGIKRICLGAAYKTPPSSALKRACEYITAIKHHGLETCATFGELTFAQAQQLKAAGLDYYNHNLDTSPKYYPEIVTTHSFDDRLTTLGNIAAAGLNICCGGILGLGESRDDRISFIHALTRLPVAPHSIPVNTLVKIAGTPLTDREELDKFELLRTIATLRLIFPKSRIRLSAGRAQLSQLEQTLCFLCGANSIFYGDKLLTADNATPDSDKELLRQLGLNPVSTKPGDTANAE